jgi:hypothetical protein
MILRGEDAELLQVTPADGIGWPQFAELYELARRKALGVDAKVDNLTGGSRSPLNNGLCRCWYGTILPKLSEMRHSSLISRHSPSSSA